MNKNAFLILVLTLAPAAGGPRFSIHLVSGLALWGWKRLYGHRIGHLCKLLQSRGVDATAPRELSAGYLMTFTSFDSMTETWGWMNQWVHAWTHRTWGPWAGESPWVSLSTCRMTESAVFERSPVQPRRDV